MPLHRVLFYEPGHFHAALTLRVANPRLAPDIHVYANPGPERSAFLKLIHSFNQRAEQPTSWQLHLHEGEQLLERLVADQHGDFVIVAGRNNTKLAMMARLTQAGLHVLADKPWLTANPQLPYLDQVTSGPAVATDIMTTRYTILSRLCHQVVSTPELFGTFIASADTASVEIASVHHLYKMVNGQPLQRPAWYYDTTVQGDGLVDVQSHMVEQAQWWVLGNAVGDFQHDVVLTEARRWTTPVPLALFQASTGLAAYPETLQSALHQGELQYACNGAIDYRLRGVRVRQTTEWRQREPQGARDLHSVTLRGSQCSVLVRQGEDTGYQVELHLQPTAGFALAAALRTAVTQWQPTFPGLTLAPSALGFRLLPPAALDHGHESHFAMVLNTFLDYLDKGAVPEDVRARIRMRYTLLARACELASHHTP